MNAEIPNNLKHTLKELRVRKGWSRQQAAEEFGVTERTINNWEKNPSALSYEKIKQVASVYDIPVNYIFFRPNI